MFLTCPKYFMDSKKKEFTFWICQVYLREQFLKIIYGQMVDPHCQVICQLLETFNLQSYNRYFTKFCIHLSQLYSMI